MNVERKTTFIVRGMVLFVRGAVFADTIHFRRGADLKCGSVRFLNDIKFELVV